MITRKACLILTILSLLAGNALAESIEDLPGVAAHVARAQEIAGDEFGFIASGLLCGPAEETIARAIRTVPGFLVPDAPGIEPMAFFDNLYYVGMYAWGTFVLDTGEGLILIDSLTNEREVEEILLPGMAELGLDPDDLTHVIVTHAHVDHYGGAAYIKETFDIPIIMSELDWQDLAHDISYPYFVRAGYPEVVQPVRDERDHVVEDGEVLEQGNSRVTFYVTPGHTQGALSLFIEVQDGGETRTVALWGGSALRTEVKELSQMHNSLHRFWEIGRELNAEAVISTHAWLVGNFKQHARGRVDGKNTIVIGAGGFDRIMGIYDECMHAQFARNRAAD